MRNAISFALLCLVTATIHADPTADLLVAAGTWNSAGVEKALKAGADANARGKHNNTPLHNLFSQMVQAQKAYKESPGAFIDIVKLLIAAGANVNAKDDVDRTPIMYAAAGEFTEIVKLLIAAKADVNIQHRGGGTALIEAVVAGNPDIVRLLIAAGADVNKKNKFNETALSTANHQQETYASSGKTQEAAVYAQIGKQLIAAGAQ